MITNTNNSFSYIIRLSSDLILKKSHYHLNFGQHFSLISENSLNRFTYTQIKNECSETEVVISKQ